MYDAMHRMRHVSACGSKLLCRCRCSVLWMHWLACDAASDACMIWQQVLQRPFGVIVHAQVSLNITMNVHAQTFVFGCCTGGICSDACCLFVVLDVHGQMCVKLLNVLDVHGQMCVVCPAWSDVCQVAECVGCAWSDVCCVPCSMGIETRHAWGMTETSPIGTSGSLKVLLSASASHNSTCIMG